MVRRKLNYRNKGFTLLELFAITLIVAILAFMGWRSYKVSRDMEREAHVRVNMRVAEIAAKSYFKDVGGSYPPASDDPAFMSYFPGGSCDLTGTRPGRVPINPFTGRPEPLKPGNITDVEQARAHLPKIIGQAGEIFYSPISAPGSTKITSYAIQGAGHDGKSLSGSDPTTSLVVSTPAVPTAPVPKPQ
jgi:type II secretory pathway pseudopilin PulG